MDRLSPYAPQALALLRIMAALMLIEHGTLKLFNFPPGEGPAMQFELMSLMGLAAILEVGGGALLLLGVFTRPAAFILSGHMAVAYFMSHNSQGFWPVHNHGEAAILFCFIFLYIACAGPGAWSLDAVPRKKA